MGRGVAVPMSMNQHRAPWGQRPSAPSPPQRILFRTPAPFHGAHYPSYKNIPAVVLGEAHPGPLTLSAWVTPTSLTCAPQHYTTPRQQGAWAMGPQQLIHLSQGFPNLTTSPKYWSDVGIATGELTGLVLSCLPQGMPRGQRGRSLF